LLPIIDLVLSSQPEEIAESEKGKEKGERREHP
jgi:hypothetical protein